MLKSILRNFYYKSKSICSLLNSDTYECSTISKILKMQRKKEIYHIINNLRFLGDEICTTHNIDFGNEEKFRTAIGNCYEGVPNFLVDSAKKDLLWRYHICCWAASKCMDVEGDFVELGVWYGLLSRTICDYVNFDNCPKSFYLVDSWGKMQGSHTNPVYANDIYENVCSRFKDYKNVKLIRGLVPEALIKLPIQKIAFLGIDMNGSKPERAALEYYYNKISPGGIIFFDDYGWNYPELRREVDDFFYDKPEKLLHFPTGNSIVIKS